MWGPLGGKDVWLLVTLINDVHDGGVSRGCGGIGVDAGG